MTNDTYYPFIFWRSPRLFYLDVEDKRIYYNSLTNEVVCVSNDEKDPPPSDNQIYTELTQDNRLIKQWTNERDATALLTIYFTQRCNLCCAYCYAKHEDQILDPKTAINAFKHWYESATRSYCTKLLINFHGSGEPLLELDNLKRVMDAINSMVGQMEVNLVKMLTTNGTLLTGDNLTWACKNFDAITISDDGPSEISTRCSKGDTVHDMKSIIEHANSHLKQNNKICKIRSTIYSTNIHKAVDLIGYYQNLGVDLIDYAPLLYSGTKEGERFEISIRDFMPVYYEALLEAKRRSIRLISHVCSPVGGRIAPCGAVGQHLNYVLMPDKRVSSCYFDTDGDLNLVFSFGSASDTGVLYDEERIGRLREMGNNVRPEKCKNCPAVYNCGVSCIYAHKRRYGKYSSGLSDDGCKAVLDFHGRILSDMFGG